MISRSLARRLERLEEHVIPEDERKVWEDHYRVRWYEDTYRSPD